MSTPNYDQIAFDMAFTHLAQQGVKSKDEETGNCQYRSAPGLSCALGVFMSDSDARFLDGECGGSWEQVTAAVASAVGGLPSVQVLGHIQDAHDDAAPYFWRERAKTIAEKFNLSTAAIDALDWSACEATA